MSRRNRNRNREPQAINAMAPTTDSDMVSRETPPYHSEDHSFGTYGGRVDGNQLTQYLNTFALENDAALLQMIPTAPGSYLFIWEMP